MLALRARTRTPSHASVTLHAPPVGIARPTKRALQSAACSQTASRQRLPARSANPSAAADGRDLCPLVRHSLGGVGGRAPSRRSPEGPSGTDRRATPPGKRRPFHSPVAQPRSLGRAAHRKSAALASAPTARDSSAFHFAHSALLRSALPVRLGPPSRSPIAPPSQERAALPPGAVRPNAVRKDPPSAPLRSASWKPPRRALPLASEARGPGRRITSPSSGNARCSPLRLALAGLRCGLGMRRPPKSACPPSKTALRPPRRPLGLRAALPGRHGSATPRPSTRRQSASLSDGSGQSGTDPLRFATRSRLAHCRPVNVTLATRPAHQVAPSRRQAARPPCPP